MAVSTLACAFIQNMIFPPSPTAAIPIFSPTSAPPTVEPALPTQTATVHFEPACPSLLADIMRVATDPSARTPEEETPVHFLVTYTIEEDKLGKRLDIFVPNELKSEWDARAAHEALWRYFAALIPEQEREYVAEFSVMSDGYENGLASVGLTYDDLTKWGLNVDILDSRDPHLFTFTLMHEFGHLHTLNSKQVAIDRLLLRNPEDAAIRDRAVSACPQYHTGTGCSQPNSYLSEFFNRYWKDLFSEWQEIEAEVEEDEIYYSRLGEFYKIYQDQFLTKYAATSPTEDIAESWAFFVLSPKPALNSIADEKILFFYEYPELVTLRQELLNRVCAEFPK